MIKLTITGQTLSIVTSKVVAGTHDYLEVEGDFRTPDWRNLRKWVHFIQLDQHYILPMHEDRISAEQHLDLTGGTWDVYVHGNYIDDHEVTERVTTGIRYLWVEGPHEGKPFPPLTPEFEEVLANEVEQALDIAQSVRDDADAGEFDGATYLPNVDEEGNISWTNDKEKPNPEPRNIMGPPGPVGPTTVMVSETPPEEDRINVWIDPRGQVGKVIVSWELISGTHQPGTYDTYLVTFQDGSTLTIPVYNGADGDGTGDMLKSVYDPQNKSEDVFAYADDAAEDVKDTTDVTGLLKGSGGNIVRAVPGTDYQTPITVDTALSGTSTNPVQNKAIKAALDGKANTSQIPTALKNPYALSIVNGGTTTNYDGSVARTLTIDAALSGTSTNPVQNKAIKAALDGKQNTLTIDTALSNTSTNPVQNKAIKAALDGKQNTLTIDTALSGTSTNPVQNKVIKAALDGKANTSQIPTALKSPYALTLVKDGVTTTYDGSSAKTITIPSGGGGGGGMTVISSIYTQASVVAGENIIYIPESVWKKTGYNLVGLVGVITGYKDGHIYGFHGSQNTNVKIDIDSKYAFGPFYIQIDGLYVPA